MSLEGYPGRGGDIRFAFLIFLGLLSLPFSFLWSIARGYPFRKDERFLWSQMVQEFIALLKTFDGKLALLRLGTFASIIGLALAVSLALELAPGVTSQGTLYLLSAIAQSMAAILALVFTISLVVVQLLSRYSYRMLSNMLDASTVGLFVLFVVAVFLPFWVLVEPSAAAVKASLILAGTCLLLLIPYSVSLRGKLDPANTLRKLRETAVGDWESPRVVKRFDLEDMLSTMENVTMSALTYRDYDTFEVGTHSLADVGHAASLQFPLDREFDPFARLAAIGISGLQDPRAPAIVLKALVNAGERTWETKGMAMHYVCVAIAEIGLRAAETNAREAVWASAHAAGRLLVGGVEGGGPVDAVRIQSLLLDLALKCEQHKDQRGLKVCVGYLWAGGAWAGHLKSEAVWHHALKSLGAVEDACGSETLTSALPDRNTLIRKREDLLPALGEQISQLKEAVARRKD